MDNGLSSPRTEAFPAGLRVLVVDDDLPWLRILEKMLRKCSYEVTTCSLAREALDLLRERKDGFDIVISDVNMPDMDGFKLLEHVGLEMDLPVIMMSVDGETSRVMRGVQHGACDYLLKPIRMKELRNIWQHVFRKRIHEVRDIESHEGFDELQMRRLEHFYDGLFLGAGELFSGKKRKDIDSNEFSDSSSLKKARVIWTVDLHQKFVTAVNQIGLDKVGPKKILDLMNVPWLTRENVASHLQKYRLYLGRLQKENETKSSFGAVKETDLTSKESLVSVSPRNLTNLQQNNSGIEICAISGNNAFVQKVDPKFCDTDLEKIVLLPIQESKKARIQDLRSFRPLEPHVKYAPFDSPIRETYFWNQVPETPFKKEERFSQLSQNTPPRHFEVDCVPLENKRKEPKEMKPSYVNNIRQQVRETGSFQGETVPDSLKNQLFVNDPKTSFALSSGDLFSWLFQGDNHYKTNVEIQTKESFNPIFPEILSETTMYMYDPQRLENEYQWESPEYPVIDQGLFII